MTALQLLFYVNAALLIQVASGIGLVVWRRRGAHAVMPGLAAVNLPRTSPGAWLDWRDFRVVRRKFEDAAKTHCSFHLEPVDGAQLLPFKPGQYLTFSLLVADGVSGITGTDRTITRCYSLSDGPDPTSYRVTVKRVLSPTGRPALPPGASSSHFHDRVREGDILRLKAPTGHFFIDPDPSVPTVLIAGGIGVTPMISMLRWCLTQQPQ